MKISSDEFNDLIMVIKRRIGVDKRNGKTIKYEDIDSYIDTVSYTHLRAHET